MNRNSDQDTTSTGPGLPFEPITMLIGLVRRWRIFAVIVLGSLVVAVIAAMLFTTRVYEARTVMLFKGNENDGRTPPLSTQLHMVKIPGNLEEVRERLELPVDIKSLGWSIDVDVERKTSLMTIGVYWTTAQEAADIANTVRDVFLEKQLELVVDAAEKELKLLEGRYSTVLSQLASAEMVLQKFIDEHKIIDLDKDVQWTSNQLISLQITLANAKVELETIESQQNWLKEQFEQANSKAAQEKASAAQVQSLADLNIRIERLRRAIHDNKVTRENDVDLIKYRQAYERTRELFEKRLISKATLEEAKANFERQVVKAVDTEQVSEWKRQLKILEEQVVPPKEEFKGAVLETLQNLQAKMMEQELNALGTKQKLGFLQKEIDRLVERLDQLVDLQRRYGIFAREVKTAQTERLELERALSKARLDKESLTPDFTIVSEAKKPVYSIRSNRRRIFATVVGIGILLGLTLILALELLDTTIKSAAELASKCAVPILGVIPGAASRDGLFPDTTKFPLIEISRIFCRHLRQNAPKKGLKVLITSPGRDTGRTLVAANLAACFGRQDERVLLIDGQIRSTDTSRDVGYMLPESVSSNPAKLKGLSEYLSFQIDHPQEMIFSTAFPGVECIPRTNETIAPDLLASNRMHELMEMLSKRFSIILIDGPAVEDFVDAELLARECDVVILVVRSRVSTAAELRKAVERLQRVSVPIMRCVLNDVDKLYMRNS